MPETPKKFFLTTPIYYVNARPHIGHAYTTIVADVLARRHRLLDYDTWFLTGTDEHGQKIERSAAAAGIPPQEFADQVSASFEALWKRMGITHNDFIRTTEPRHKRGAQKLFSTLYENGFIYLASYTGSYCVSDEAFVDAPVGTPCPDCGRLLEEVTEENFFFKLSEFQEKLVQLIESEQLVITPGTARNEVLSFVRGNIASVFGPNELRKSWENNPVTFEEMGREAVKLGRAKEYAPGKFLVLGALKDLSISRSSFAWGIPVPPEIQVKERTKQPHVIYVWLDALANYMTALGYGAQNPDGTPAPKPLFEKFWPADLHLVGKEITRFHCVYWPAFLIAADQPTPKQITANGWLLFDNSKMSKSKGNIVRTETILDAFGEHVYKPQFPDSSKHDQDLFASDVLRYFLLREVPFGQDGNFSLEAMVTRYNADLANGYGNLVSRTLAMIKKYFEGVVPTPSDVDKERLASIIAGIVSHQSNYENSMDFSGLIEAIWGMLASTDQYITRLAPWKLAVDPNDRQRLADVLYNSAEFIRCYTALCYEYLPYATASVWRQLGLGDIELAAHNGELNNLQWGGLKPGTKLGPLAPIFPRADKGLAQIMADMESANKPSTPTTDPAAGPRTSTLEEPNPGTQVAASTATTTERPAAPEHSEAPSAPNQPADASPQITIDDFARVELRVAKVLVCERIPKADKLLRLEVDLGYEQRQILSGIAEWYTPEDLIGRRIVVITNLAPRKMRGLESHGMLLAASAPEGGKPALATFAETDELPLGSRLK